jgi:peptidyl-prolyl cis-trans isomerase SurA
MVGQIGSMDKVVEYYNKSSEEEFRELFLDILRAEIDSEMQIIGEVVHLKRFVFFKTIPRRISFGAEEVAQIVVTPKVSDAEAKLLIN